MQIGSYIKTRRPFNFMVTHGPSFLNDMPSEELWLTFANYVDDHKTKELAALWYQKCLEANNVPLRSQFNFKDLVKFGKNLFLAKQNDKGSWVTTYCGTEVVTNVGSDITGQTLEEFGDENAIKFWMKNLEVITKRRSPLYEFYTMEFANKEHIHCTGLNLPLRSKDSTVPDMFFSYEIYTPHSLYHSS